MSDGVFDLVEHVWQEAVGELNAILAVPIESINLEQVVVLRDQHLLNTYLTKSSCVTARGVPPVA